MMPDSESNINTNPLIIGGGFAEDLPSGLTREEYYANDKASSKTNCKPFAMALCFLVLGGVGGVAASRYLIWPKHHAFVRGDLHETLTAPDIQDILDFSFYPFGNAYIGNGDVDCNPLTCKVEGFYSYYNETSSNPDDWNACGDGRTCWQTNCGAGSTFSDSACSTGDAVYQHGPGEGLTDVLEACAMNSVGDVSQFSLWFPFVYCLEGVLLNDALTYPNYAYGIPINETKFVNYFQPYFPDGIVEAHSFHSAINFTMAQAQQCAYLTGLNYSYIEECARPSVGPDGQLEFGAEGEALESANALATVQLDPPHQYTPWVVLEGTPILVSDDDQSLGYSQLLSWVCAEYLTINSEIDSLVLPVGCPTDPVSIDDV